MAWYFRPWSRELNTVASEEHFDPSKVPMVTDRVREALANYERTPTSRRSRSRAKAGALPSARPTSKAPSGRRSTAASSGTKGHCRIYAVGNVVIWSRTLLPLPFDVRSEVLEASFLPDKAS